MVESNPATSKPQRHHDWIGRKEGGANFGWHLITITHRFLGRVTKNIITIAGAIYFFASDGTARRASRSYLTRVGKRAPEHSIEPNFKTVFRHILEYGHTWVDRITIWLDRGRGLEIEWDMDIEALLQRCKEGEGGIFLSAHLGSAEIARAVCESLPGVKINALVFTKNLKRFYEFLNRIHPQSNLGVIPLQSISPATIETLRGRVEAGEWIGVLGDRVSAKAPGRSHPISFLGDDAHFPEGPIVLASLIGCPVYTLFCTRLGHGHYKISVRKFADSISLQRKHRDDDIRQHLTNFASQLEKQCYDSPLQWFNFFNFWGDE